MVDQAKKNDFYRVPDQYEYDGITFPGMMIPKDMVDHIKNEYKFRDGDIIIATYPKSGNSLNI